PYKVSQDKIFYLAASSTLANTTDRAISSTQILMRAGCLRIRKSKKAAKSSISCMNFIKHRLTEAMREEKVGVVDQ
ncbi:hypothetical protein T12_16401, partial [Trichinella patagoniensis]